MPGGKVYSYPPRRGRDSRSASFRSQDSEEKSRVLENTSQTEDNTPGSSSRSTQSFLTREEKRTGKVHSRTDSREELIPREGDTLRDKRWYENYSSSLSEIYRAFLDFLNSVKVELENGPSFEDFVNFVYEHSGELS